MVILRAGRTGIEGNWVGRTRGGSPPIGSGEEKADGENGRLRQAREMASLETLVEVGMDWILGDLRQSAG